MNDKKSDIDLDAEALYAPPKGTWIIMFIYGVLFTLGWLYMWFGIFIPRGPVS
jgi:hypothetical protein